MTLKSHNGNWGNNDILVYKSYSGSIFNGVKVLKAVWIDEISDYQYVVQHGSVKENVWVPSSDGKSLSISSHKDITSGYDQKWTKDTLAPVKGDILMGVDKYSRQVILYFESDALVHRLTAMDDSSQSQSSAPLDYYKRKLTGIKVLKNTFDAKPFSKI